MTMEEGRVIASKYRLLRPLGSGAMGTVWAAINQGTDGEVALKLLMPGADAETRRRLLREAKACGRLKHRNIVEIYDVSETDEGDPFLVMALLHGETLADRIKRTKGLPQEVAVSIACDVALALRHAHEKEVVHRDLKPANIFLHLEADAHKPQTKVVDFGVSKLAIEDEGGSTVAGSLIGSPAYMSPEQGRSERVDGRTDVWALGVVLYEMLAGQRPFRGKGAVAVIGEILHGAIPRIEAVAPHVSPRLGDVISACLTRELHGRVQSAGDLHRLLLPFLPGEAGAGGGGVIDIPSPAAREVLAPPVVPEDAPSRSEEPPLPEATTELFTAGTLFRPAPPPVGPRVAPVLAPPALGEDPSPDDATMDASVLEADPPLTNDAYDESLEPTSLAPPPMPASLAPPSVMPVALPAPSKTPVIVIAAALVVALLVLAALALGQR